MYNLQVHRWVLRWFIIAGVGFKKLNYKRKLNPRQWCPFHITDILYWYWEELSMKHYKLQEWNPRDVQNVRILCLNCFFSFCSTGCLSALVYQHAITPLALPCKLLIPTTGMRILVFAYAFLKCCCFIFVYIFYKQKFCLI